MNFHHFGLLSLQAEASRHLLGHLGYTVGEPVEDPLQNVRLYWATHPAWPAIEIITPSDAPGPVSNLLKSFKQGIYHLCFEVTELAAALEQLGACGRVVQVTPPRPAILFQQRRVSFHFVENLGLVELLEPAT